MGRYPTIKLSTAYKTVMDKITMAPAIIENRAPTVLGPATAG